MYNIATIDYNQTAPCIQSSAVYFHDEQHPLNSTRPFTNNKVAYNLQWKAKLI